MVDGRLVPNATEQAVTERMKSMRAATYRDIGGELGMYARTVQRIPDRGLIVEGRRSILSLPDRGERKNTIGAPLFWQMPPTKPTFYGKAVQPRIHEFIESRSASARRRSRKAWFF